MSTPNRENAEEERLVRRTRLEPVSDHGGYCAKLSSATK